MAEGVVFEAAWGTCFGRAIAAFGTVPRRDAGQLAAYITDDGNLTNPQVQQWLPTLPPQVSIKSMSKAPSNAGVGGVAEARRKAVHMGLS
ncbi:MAG: hypothetical protein JF606_26940 [Burkholderiales bacterium]|jgi:hypothetical protein|nr:hypothetical protein [Burkholderiales bacterium]